MTAIDALLMERHREGRPVQVALVGAGAIARMIALQLLAPPIPGLRLAVVANRTPEKAAHCFTAAGPGDPVPVRTAAELMAAMGEGRAAFTDDAFLPCEADGIDVIVDATGTVEHGAAVALRAISGGKHLVLVNAELDATLGPILRLKASQAGTVFTNTDGDEPGVAMTLIRYLRTLGLAPVAAGNLKGMIDPYRNPETQREFAARAGQNPRIITSFADGTKLALEETILANATGFGVGRRGMYGPRCAHVREIAAHLPVEQMLAGGLVDYALGAEPHTGAFVVVHEPHPEKRRHLAYLKMGDGPFYVFYTPYHLPHVQVASTIARAALQQDPTVAPAGPPVCEVLAVAKRDLRAGEVLDGVGGFTCYGTIDNAGTTAPAGCLPMGLSEGCVLRRDLGKDAALTFDDVEVPSGRLADRLHAEQRAAFPPR